MPETTACTCRSGRCHATPALHVREAAEYLLSLAARYDSHTEFTPGQQAKADQAIASFRGAVTAMGIDCNDRASVSKYVAGCGWPISLMDQALGAPGGRSAAAAAKTVVLAMPLIEELARG